MIHRGCVMEKLGAAFGLNYRGQPKTSQVQAIFVDKYVAPAGPAGPEDHQFDNYRRLYRHLRRGQLFRH